MTPAQLRRELSRLGLTQVGLAELLGVDPTTVRRWLMPPGRKSALRIPAWLPLALRGIEQAPR